MIWLGDPLYALSAVPGLGLALWAGHRVRGAYAEGTKAEPGPRLSGGDAAAALLRAAGLDGVSVASVSPPLADYYDPRGRVLRLSHEVYEGRTLTALGIAAHEAGHALQQAGRHPGLIVRNLLVPIATLGSQVAWLVLLSGVLLDMLELVYAAVALLTLNVMLQLAGLPFELDASRRGREALRAAGLLDEPTAPVLQRVMDAAALRHVGEALTGVLELIPFLARRRRATVAHREAGAP